MKLALVYNPEEPKLQADNYSQVYRDMFLALQDRFEEVVHICNDRPGDDLDVDVIIFYDLHSSHHIVINDLKNHAAIKIEYMNDPHQQTVRGHYRGGPPVHKLGAAERIARARARDIDYIICPYREAYYKYLAPHLGADADRMLMWFPLAPDPSRFTDGDRPLVDRVGGILANGATWAGQYKCYEFRKWVHRQTRVDRVEHWIKDPHTPKGADFGRFAAGYKGALALTEYFPIPKYFELPLAGCVTFAQHHDEYEGDLGFRDYKHCIYLTQENFTQRTINFIAHPEDYQHIATAGREKVLNNYTSKHFADYVYNFVKDRL